MESSDLLKLGFTENEAKVYLALLEVDWTWDFEVDWWVVETRKIFSKYNVGRANIIFG